MAGSRRPLRLQPLPPDVDVSELRLPARPTPWALVGVSGDEPVPVGIDLATERVVLVAGPPGSGRTTALTTMARSLHEQGARVLALCPERSPLRKGPWRSAWFDESGALPADLIPQASVVLVDDAERLDGPTESLLLAAAAHPRQSVVVAGLTSALLGSYRGLAGLARSHRTGVLLRPESPTDGDVLGVRADLFDETPPGRALLVVRGTSTPVQVARSPSP
jgi:S-DNA-T family DNA segregation ATPase FtsK/SpoIIIE